MDKRPVLNNKISVNDFKDFYWLKSELMNFCQEIGISSSGGKIEIANRITEYLETGKAPKTKTKKTKKLPQPTHPITKETIIGIEYRSYKEKKEFFQSVIGNNFTFTVHLLDYFKQNAGKKTYSDVIKEWHKEQELKKDPNFVKEIAPQFEYNIYIREFLNDNPDKSKNDAIKYWKIKRAKRGDNKYSKQDLI
jgi:regulator of sigma D